MISYHRHSHLSNCLLPDSVVTNEDYAKRAVELGQTILSSCEHGTAGNYRECADIAKKYGLRWRYVMEAYFVKDRLSQDRTNAHLILAAKTEKGIYDLNEVMSEANISGYYYRPRVDFDLLERLDPKDVFVTTACIAGIWQYGYDKDTGRYNWEEPLALLHRLHAHFRDSLMLEVQYHDADRQRAVNENILRLYRSEGIPLVCGLDSHVIYPEQEKLRADFLASKHLVYGDEAGFYFDYPDEDTTFARFKKQGVLSDQQIAEAITNTDVFLDFEDVSFDKSRKLPTLYPDKTQDERNELYRQIIRDRWREYRKTVPKERWPEYLEGIKYEVDTITDTNTSDYFLISQAFVDRYKKMGGAITKTGRGSAPSYFTNMLLGLSSIDRFQIPVTMYPDRFVSRERLKTSMPDIDNNVGSQELAGQALSEIMGPWRSAQMVAFGTLKRLSAWKMYCRATDVPFDTANTISDALKRYELDAKHADEEERDAISAYDYVPPEYHEQLRMSEKYLGMIDSISPHPCAFLLCQNDIRREIGIFRLNAKGGKKGIVYAAFIDGATADGYGYLKEDLLAVDVVKVNADIYRRIGTAQPDVPKLMEMVDGDRATWDMYAKGYTLGLNQAEREKSTEKVMRYRPKNLTELSAFVAGIRPAFQSMIDKLLNRQHFDYGIPALDELLQTPEMPNSFILYQEQLMKTLQYAGFEPSESYAAIKAIAKKHPEKVLPLKERFLNGFMAKLKEHGTDDTVLKETADRVWKIISDACGYGFNSCVTGDTKLYRWPSRLHPFCPSVSEMYRILHDPLYAKQTGHRSLHDKYKRNGYGTALSLCQDGRIRENRIVDIRYQGKRPVLKITTASGATVRCTWNHRFPVVGQAEMVCADDLRVGDRLYRLGEYEKNNHKYTYTNGDYESNCPKSGERGFQRRENGASVVYLTYRHEKENTKASCERCGCPYCESGHFELHHIDNDSTHNTTDNYLWLCNSCHKKIHYREHNRVGRYEKGIPSIEDPIVSIEQCGEEDVWDIEMEAPFHNFVLDNRMVVGNSHSVSVALDSLYTAWAKAHHPLETYTALMSNYAEKGDKDRIDRAKQEMQKAFGIRIVLPRFRQDNRDFFLDHEANTISDSLVSVKHLSKRVADALWRMRNNTYDTFVDLLFDMTMQPVFTTQSIEILIRLGYFEEFGGTAKLMSVFRAFFEDKGTRFSKAHVKATQEKRLDELRRIEKQTPDEELSATEKVSFEAEVLGTPVTVDKEAHALFCVLDADAKYSPKLTLYNIASGTTGQMKVRKQVFAANPLTPGTVIRLKKWTKKKAMRFENGKAVPRIGVYDNWLEQYEILK